MERFWFGFVVFVIGNGVVLFCRARSSVWFRELDWNGLPRVCCSEHARVSRLCGVVVWIRVVFWLDVSYGAEFLAYVV